MISFSLELISWKTGMPFKHVPILVLGSVQLSMDLIENASSKKIINS
jgi:hypothetical protein